MLKKLLFLLLLPIALYSAGRGPKAEYGDSTIHLNRYANDYKTSTLYYESVPIVSQDSKSNLLSLIPILIQDTVTGEVRMQIFFSFYHSDSNTTMPRTMRVSSHKRHLSLPVLNPYKTLEIDTNITTINANTTSRNNLSTTVQKTQQTDPTTITSGSVYIFTDEANKLIDLVRDTQSATHDTLSIATTVPSKNASNTKFTPRKYTLSDLQDRYERNISKGLIPEHRLDNTLFMSIPFDNTYQITFALDNGENLLLSPYYTTILFNFMLFYTQLSGKFN